MFVAKKIISSFLLPSGIFVLIFLFISLWFYLRKDIRNFKIFAFLALIFYLFLTNFWVNFLICRLEKKIRPDINGDVIVFLSAGNSNFKDLITSDYYLSSSSSERLFAAYRIYKEKKLPIILTGGRIFGLPSDAEISRGILIKLGVLEKDIFFENKSKDTYENAIYSKNIANLNGFKKPIIVTESTHIPRSVWSFKKAGFDDVLYYPSSYFCHKTNFYDFLPSDLYYHRKYFHEILGSFFYKILY